MKNLTFIVLILLGSLNAMAQVVDTSKVNQLKEDVSNISTFELWEMKNSFKDIENDIEAINLRLDKTKKRRKTGIAMMALGLGSTILGTVLATTDANNGESVGSILVIGGSTLFTIGLFVK